MIPLGRRTRRVLGLLGATGLTLQALYLAVVVVASWTDPVTESTRQERAYGAFWWGVGFLFIGLVIWQCLEAAAGRMLRTFRVVFLLITPLPLFLLRGAVGQIMSTSFTPAQFALDLLYVFVEASMAVALPVLALSRSEEAPESDEGDGWEQADMAT